VARRESVNSGRRTTAVAYSALPYAVPGVLIAGWWFASLTSTSPYFPPLRDIVTSFREVWLSETFISDAVPSITNFFVGFAVASLLGIAGGMAIGLTPVLADSVAPILEFLRAVPGVTLLPAAVLLLGIGSTMQVSMIVWGAVWPILLNSIDGARAVDPTVRDVVRSYHIGRKDRILRVVLPAAAPQIAIGMRTAVSIGITVIVFSEMIGSTSGIGYQIIVAQRSFAVTDMWAGMVLLGLLGFALNTAFRIAERRVLAWHHTMQGLTDGPNR
jgi:sulfonate transport system permease protein